MELYDKKDPKSIERYGKGMIGKTFRQIWKENAESGSGSQTLMERTETSRYAERHSQKRYKGGMAIWSKNVISNIRVTAIRILIFPKLV